MAIIRPAHQFFIEAQATLLYREFEQQHQIAFSY